MLFSEFEAWMNKNEDPSLALKVQKKWNSTYTDYRLLIRKDLAKRLGAPEILDLSDFPKNLSRNISISHSPIFGGYALSDRPMGLDVEQLRRISLHLVKRVCQPEELKWLEKNPLWSPCVWTLKEASYKALRLTEEVLSEIVVKDIIEVDKPEGFAGQILSSECSYKKQKLKALSVFSEEFDVVASISYPVTL